MAGLFNKTVCPVSKAFFFENAKNLIIIVDGQPVTAEVKEFSTGSFGWYLNGKVHLNVGGKKVAVQCGFNMTLVGSKEAPEKKSMEEMNIRTASPAAIPATAPAATVPAPAIDVVAETMKAFEEPPKS
jgi:hypothetical protein